MTKISVFKNILHDAWLERNGPYSRRPPSESELSAEIRGDLHNYFKNEAHGEWITTLTQQAISWVLNGSSSIDDIVEITRSFNDTTSSDERAHYQAFLELAEWLKDYA